MSAANRAQYSDEIKEIVRAKYPLCRTPADRDALAEECGIDSRQKLYNLASRLLATRPHANSQSEWTEEDSGYDATQDKSRLLIRDNPKDLIWTEDNDRYLREHFGKTFIESIGFMLNRSETACAYRARKLSLRNIPKYYDLAKVTSWLGISYKEAFILGSRGMDIFPCTDKDGELQVNLVSTTSLARTLLHNRFWKVLVDKRGADQFFILDVVESIVALQKNEANWEPNPWVSHGHTCLNPFSEACFGWFYDGYDDKMSGSDLDPLDLAPSADVNSDNWRRGSFGRSQFEDEVQELIPEAERFSKEVLVAQVTLG